MKPMGRQHYIGNSGSKHNIKGAGKAYAWWKTICTPSNKRERQQVKCNITKEITEI